MSDLSREEVQNAAAQHTSACQRQGESLGWCKCYCQYKWALSLLEMDTAARTAVETWDEIGQEGCEYVERLRATLLPEPSDE